MFLVHDIKTFAIPYPQNIPISHSSLLHLWPLFPTTKLLYAYIHMPIPCVFLYINCTVSIMLHVYVFSGEYLALNHQLMCLSRTKATSHMSNSSLFVYNTLYRDEALWGFLNRYGSSSGIILVKLVIVLLNMTYCYTIYYVFFLLKFLNLLYCLPM